MPADVTTAARVTQRGHAGVSRMNSELRDLTSAYQLRPINTHFDCSVKFTEVETMQTGKDSIYASC